MAKLDSWLSPVVMHALRWTLIHSMWQCMAVAAVAAAPMGFSRSPSIRYLVATGALVAMLAAPVATLFVLMKSGALVQTFPPASSGSFVSGAPAIADESTFAVPQTATGTSTESAFENFSRVVSSPNAFPSLSVLAWLVGGVVFRGSALQPALRRRIPASGV